MSLPAGDLQSVTSEACMHQGGTGNNATAATESLTQEVRTKSSCVNSLLGSHLLEERQPIRSKSMRCYQGVKGLACHPL